MDKRPGTVIFGIMTDGQENSSKEWTRAAIKKLIEQQESQFDWTFSYMVANQDAIEEGATLEIPAERSLTYGTGNVADAMGAYGACSTMLRGAVAAGLNLNEARARSAYSPVQRAAAAGTKDLAESATPATGHSKR